MLAADLCEPLTKHVDLATGINSGESKEQPPIVASPCEEHTRKFNQLSPDTLGFSVLVRLKAVGTWLIPELKIAEGSPDVTSNL